MINWETYNKDSDIWSWIDNIPEDNTGLKDIRDQIFLLDGCQLIGFITSIRLRLKLISEQSGKLVYNPESLDSKIIHFNYSFFDPMIPYYDMMIEWAENTLIDRINALKIRKIKYIPILYSKFPTNINDIIGTINDDYLLIRGSYIPLEYLSNNTNDIFLGKGIGKIDQNIETYLGWINIKSDISLNNCFGVNYDKKFYMASYSNPNQSLLRSYMIELSSRMSIINYLQKSKIKLQESDKINDITNYQFINDLWQQK